MYNIKIKDYKTQDYKDFIYNKKDLLKKLQELMERVKINLI